MTPNRDWVSTTLLIDGTDVTGKGSIGWGPREEPEYVHFDDGKRIIESRARTTGFGDERMMILKQDGVIVYRGPVTFQRRYPRFRRPRFLHRAFAGACGFFWAPCPVCGRMRGGHEKPRGTMMESLLDPSRGTVTCWGCPGYYWPDATSMDTREYGAIMEASEAAYHERLLARNAQKASGGE